MTWKHLTTGLRISALAVFLWVPAAGAEALRVSEEGRRAISPEIAIGPDGAINIVWLDKGLTVDRPPPKPRKPGEHSHRSFTDLYFSRSEDGGASWSRPTRINDSDGEVWGFSVSKPRIAVGPSGTIHVFYPANDRAETIDKDVVSARYRRSTDNGKSFSAAITMNRPVTEDREEILGEGLAMTNSFGTMGVAPDGTVITAWQNVATMEDQSGGADGVVAISTDDGISFSSEIIAIPGNKICPCCQLTLAFGQDTALMGLRYLFEDGRDSTVAVSTDGGRNFDMAGRLDLDPWDIDGCPLKPTELAIHDNHVFAATYTGGETPPGLYFTVSKDGGKTFSGNQQVHADAAIADAPALTVDAQGRVRLVWHAKVEGQRRLYTSTSLDFGETLSAPMEISTPAGKAMNPATAVADDGSVFVTWQQENEEVYVTRLPAPMPDKPVLTPVNAESLSDHLQALQEEGDTAILVNFWATWCQPCREEIPIFMDLEKKYGDQGFRLVAISLDEAESIETVVRPFMTKWFPGFTSLYSVEYDMDDLVSTVDNAWNEVLPTSYLYSRNGELFERLQGKYAAAEFESRIITVLQD